MKSVAIDLPVLLPDVPDEHDACVERLQALIDGRPGMGRVHVRNDGTGIPALCLHYDPSVVTLAQVERLAHAAGANVTGRFGHALIPIRLVGGEDAARGIEAELSRYEGVLSASVNLPAQVARVEFERGRITPERIRSSLAELGAPPSEPVEATRAARDRPASDTLPVKEKSWYSSHKELVWSLIGGALLLVAWAGERWAGIPHPLALVLFFASYGFGAFDLVGHTAKSLKRGHVNFDIDLLMLLAALGAAVLGEWAEGAFLLFLFSLAHALEHFALDRARGAIRALSDLAPPRARVVKDGREIEVPVEEVRAGDVIVVRPAERIPVDGKVRSGRSAVDQAPITGESVPAEKEPGAEVYAGTINGEGALEIDTTRAAGDRTLDRVIKLVSEAQTQKAPTQQFTDRFESVFVPTVLVCDLLLIVLPPLLGFWTWQTSFYRAMSLLVAASPCALALGTPAAVLAAIAQAARKGVLIKGGAHLENLGTLRAIAFDKTGTLTVGKPEVTELAPAPDVDQNELLKVAAAVERRSQHPLAQAVVRRAEAEKLGLPEAGDLESVTARGVRSMVDGKPVEIGSLKLWEGREVPGEVRQAVETLQAKGQSIMAVRHGARWLGVLGISDRPRGGVKEVLERLRGMGIRPLVMLTGDNRGVGDAIGQEVGVDEVKADLLPEDKVTAIRSLISNHGQVAMVGDGVNDAPALANATVGVAMGGAGTAAALETADVALMGDDLAKLPFAVGLSRAARGVIRQNLYIALGVIVLLILATTTGYFGIGPAVFVHEGSTLVVLANALRLLAYRES